MHSNRSSRKIEEQYEHRFENWEIILYLTIRKMFELTKESDPRLISSYLLPQELQASYQETCSSIFKLDSNKMIKCLKQTISRYLKNPCEKGNQKLMTIWRNGSHQQIWIEISYDPDFFTLILRSYLLDYCGVKYVQCKFAKNLAMSTFEKITKLFAVQHPDLQIIIHPETGVPTVNIKIFVHDDKIKEAFINVNTASCLFYYIDLQLVACSEVFRFLDTIEGKQQLEQTNQQIKLTRQKVKDCNIYEHQCPDKIQYSLSEDILKIIEQIISQNQINPDQNLQSFINFEESYGYFLSNFKEFSPEIHKICAMISKNQSRTSQKFNKTQIYEMLSDSFSEMFRNIQEQDNSILKMIKIHTNPKLIAWSLVSQGGFGIVQKADVEYSLSSLHKGDKTQQIQIKRGWICRKSNLHSEKNKIRHEKHILNLLCNQYYPNIMTHYISEEQQFADYLFSKYQPNTSMHKYIQKNQKSISLRTIIKFLEEAAKGLMFLSSQNIIHFDIKSSNIIITKNLTAKITDFGECICREYHEKQVMLSYIGTYSRGFTLPYSAPEIFQNQNLWILEHPYPRVPNSNSIKSSKKQCLDRYHSLVTEKLDVYSLSCTIYKSIFRKHIWGDFNRQKLYYQNTKTKIPKQSFEFSFVPQIFERYGLQKILLILGNLVFKGIRQQQSQRPNLFYFSVVLALSRKYIDQLSLQGV